MSLRLLALPTAVALAITLGARVLFAQGPAAPAPAAAEMLAPVASPVSASEPVTPAPGERAPDEAEAIASVYRSQLEATWFTSGPGLSKRALATRERALELGVANHEAAARALSSPAGPEEGALPQALLAVRLAPDLPLAHMRLATVYWQEGRRREAVSQVAAGLTAIPRHLDSTFWLAGTLLTMLALVLTFGPLCFVIGVGLSVFGHAAHDIGDLLSREMPAFARTALLGSLLLVPLLLGEGVVALVLVLFTLGFAYGDARYRIVLSLAAVLFVIGVHPLPRVAGIALTALDSDRVAHAVYADMRDMATPADLEVLRAVRAEDELADLTLATHARRRAQPDVARESYLAMLSRDVRDPVVLTNLANLYFLNGNIEEAIDLYERSSRLADSPIVLFNLSQAYARAFQMDEFENAIQRAQLLAPEIVVELSHNSDSSFVADMPIPLERVRSRLVSGGGGQAFERSLIEWIAPGRIGQGWPVTGGAFALAAMIGVALGGRFEHSSVCSRCGRRICSRCDATIWSRDLCDGCHNLFQRPETTDPGLRTARLDRLRRRQTRLDGLATVASVTVPGAAGLIARRPDLGFVGVLFFGWALVLLVWRGGVVPDPLVIGEVGPVLLLLAGALALAGHLAVAAAGLMIRRSA